MEPPKVKECSRCKESLPAHKFYNSRSTKTGLSSYCKDCDRITRQLRNRRYEVTVTSKKCYSCGENKPAEDFWIDTSKKYGLSGACIMCGKNRLYLRNFGITEDDYQAMLKKQGGVCAICFQKDQVEGQRLAVDHDHASGKVRELLCGNCNKALGLLNDNTGLLDSAKEYLLKHGRR